MMSTRRAKKPRTSAIDVAAAVAAGTTSSSDISTVVFTGAFSSGVRRDIAAAAAASGYTVQNAVSKKTDVLVLGDLDVAKKSSKQVKAESLGVRIITETEWSKLAQNTTTASTVTSNNASSSPEKQSAVAAPPATQTQKVPGTAAVALNELADGETAIVDSLTSSARYRLKRTGHSYVCSCPAWMNQHMSPTHRTCKHLRAFLGDAFENERIGDQTVIKYDAATKKTAKTVAAGSVEVLLAQKWDEQKQDPKGWWMSEKLDGVRALWNGEQLLSRLGNVFPAPASFLETLPSDLELDGELMIGRGRFNDTVSIVKTAGVDAWPPELCYYVFDAPKLQFGFEERLEYIQKRFEGTDGATTTVHVVKHIKCRGREHVHQEVERVISIGGEGVMLREPGSKYIAKRSRTLLKVNRFHDAEAVVIAHEPGKGKHKGVVGALSVRMASGIEFRVGSGLKDSQRANPPAVGAIITYRFQELTPAGVPRFPTFVGEAIDKTEPKDAVLPKPI